MWYGWHGACSLCLLQQQQQRVSARITSPGVKRKVLSHGLLQKEAAQGSPAACRVWC